MITLFTRYIKDGDTFFKKTFVSILHHCGSQTISIGGRNVVTGRSELFYIPIKSYSAGGKTYVKPEIWRNTDDRESTFTFQNGDYLIIGESSLDESSSVNTLLENGAYQITDVQTLDYGSPSMQHWKLEAK